MAVLVTLFVNLGFWQLRRLEERRQANLVIAARLTDEPLPVETLVDAAGADLDSLEFRPATATGVFEADAEVMVRSQVFQGIAGFHVLTPLVLADQRALVVNRGWIPLSDGEPPASAASPVGTVNIEGLVMLSQVPTALGPKDTAEGRLDVLSRVDLDRLAVQMEWPLLPVYLAMTEPAPSLPRVLPPPNVADEGPHLGYAVQWFGFAAVALIGFVALIRRATSDRAGHPRHD